MAVRPAARTGKAAGKDAAIEVAAEFALDIGWHRADWLHITREFKPARRVVLHAAAKQRMFRPAAGIQRGARGRTGAGRHEHPDRRSRFAIEKNGFAGCMSMHDGYCSDALRVDAVAFTLYLDRGRKQREWTPNDYGGVQGSKAVDYSRYLDAAIQRDADAPAASTS